MRLLPTRLPDLRLIEPKLFQDDRGSFFESYNRREFAQLSGIAAEFVQDNQSRSKHNVLRGLHYQLPQPQGKLVRVLEGEIFDVAVDIRRTSPTFRQWEAVRLSGENRLILWVPPGFAHGFLVLSAVAEVLYKTTDFYNPTVERCIRWDDPDLAIDWPLSGEPILSPRDRAATRLRDADLFS